MSVPEKVASHTDPPDRSQRRRVIRVPANDPNPAQLGLLGPAEQEATLQENFERFHTANPYVYEEIVKLVRRAQRAGATRVGIGMVFEVLRWRHTLRTGGDDFKLNNNYRSRYARMIMAKEIDLDGMFEIRELHAP